MSVKPSARSNSSAANIGAMQIAGLCRKRTAVVSRAPSKANACGASARAEVPAIARALVRKRRRVSLIGILKTSLCFRRSRLQLAFQLVEEAPIRTLGDDLLRGGLDYAGLAQQQRKEAHGVLGVIIAPFVVDDVVHCLQRVIVSGVSNYSAATAALSVPTAVSCK